MTRGERTKSRVRAMIVALAASALLVGMGGCSDDDSSPSAGSSTDAADGTTSTGSSTTPAERGSSTTPTTTAPRPIPISKPAQRKGGEDCQDTKPAVVIERYLPAVKQSKASDTAAVRRSLIAQIKQLRKAQGANVAPPPVAAAVYAISKPRTQRSGAYQGCLKSLVEQAHP